MGLYFYFPDADNLSIAGKRSVSDIVRLLSEDMASVKASVVNATENRTV